VSVSLYTNNGDLGSFRVVKVAKGPNAKQSLAHEYKIYQSVKTLPGILQVFDFIDTGDSAELWLQYGGYPLKDVCDWLYVAQKEAVATALALIAANVVSTSAFLPRLAFKNLRFVIWKPYTKFPSYMLTSNQAIFSFMNPTFPFWSILANLS
jgi:hypothetical protein